MSASSVERILDSKCDPPVAGYLHRPKNVLRNALVLTHGAGSNSQTSLLISLAEAFVDVGFLVLRCDLPFRQRSPQGPPSPGNSARDQKGLRNAVFFVRNLATGSAFLGGHSYGGRQASMLAASDPGLVAGLLLLSYPLHPPRKPEQLRTQHFPNLRTPALFVHGSRDPFGSASEMQEALTLIPARTKLLLIDSAGHDLGLRKAANENTESSMSTRTRDEFQAFFSER